MNHQPIARFNANGSLDTFRADGDVKSIVVFESTPRKIFIGGSFTSVDGTGRNGIARLNDNGSLDTGFNPGTGATGGSVNSVAVQQSSGKVLIGGSFTHINGVSRNRIARLTPAGARDDTFQNGMAGANSDVNVVLIQPGQAGDKILIGGKFTTVNGEPRKRIARLDGVGAFDNTFNPAIDSQVSSPDDNSVVHSLLVQPDGGILVGGKFTAVSGTGPQPLSYKQLVRLNADGYVDYWHFRPGPLDQLADHGPNNSVRAIAIQAVQADKRIILGGDFTIYHVPGVTEGDWDKRRIVRLCGP